MEATILLRVILVYFGIMENEMEIWPFGLYLDDVGYYFTYF